MNVEGEPEPLPRAYASGMDEWCCLSLLNSKAKSPSFADPFDSCTIFGLQSQAHFFTVKPFGTPKGRDKLN